MAASMITLRDYQQDQLERTRFALRSYSRVLVQLPTGGGKTAMSAVMAGNAARKGRQSLFIVHRQELIDQTAATFDKAGIHYSFCAAGYRFNPGMPTLICSIDTLKHRLDKVGPRNTLFWDECHHCAAAGWSRVANHFGDAIHIGLSATPQRLDGKGLNGQFQTIVQGPSVGWLIAEGHLCDYRAFAPSAPNLENVRTLAGDFNKADLDEAMDGSVIIGDAIKHYVRHAMGRRAVAFCHSVSKSVTMAGMFNAAGIPAASLDGTSDRNERRRTIERFRNGEIRVLCNVDLFGEGFDLPAMEAVILLRPTQSLALHMQQIGRVLRPYPGKDRAIILDHAGNIARHGLPDMERTWSLEGREKDKKNKNDTPLMICANCFATFAPRRVCPECGHAKEVTPREIEERDGELEEITRDMAASRDVRRDQGMARTLEDLVRIATARGYKRPHEWAAHVHTARVAAKAKREAERNRQGRMF